MNYAFFASFSAVRFLNTKRILSAKSQVYASLIFSWSYEQIGNFSQTAFFSLPFIDIQFLYNSCPVRLGGFALLRVEDPLPAACALPADCAEPTISLELSAKPTILASWRPGRPPDGPPGVPDDLPTAPGAPGLPTGLLAPKTAFRRASWRPRRPPDGPPGAQDGLPTGLLAPGTP